MMEALKLLTSELTDLNQTELIGASSLAGEEEVGAAELSYLPSSLGGLMSRSLLQLKRSPALLSQSALSLTNSRFRLRAL